jgi:hypothetical protein
MEDPHSTVIGVFAVAEINKNGEKVEVNFIMLYNYGLKSGNCNANNSLTLKRLTILQSKLILLKIHTITIWPYLGKLKYLQPILLTLYFVRGISCNRYVNY